MEKDLPERRKDMAGTKHLVFQEIINRGMYDDYLNFAAYMHIMQGMSYFNSALVFLQRPGAVCVKSEQTWLRDYDRTLRPGVTPIVIMKIGGPVSFVYDIADTVGEKVPPLFKNIMECHEVSTPLGELYSALQYVVREAGIYYSESPMGLRKYGESRCEFPNRLTFEHRGETKTTSYSVTINSTANETNKAAAILHEMAHILCGHFTCEDEKSVKTFKLPKRKDIDKNTAEYEAEKTAEYVCKAMGIEYDAEDYLKDYDTKNVDKTLSEPYILDAMQRLVDLMLKAGVDPHLVEEGQITDNSAKGGY